MTTRTMEILEALRDLLGTIDRPAYRSKVGEVKIGLTAGDLNGGPRPLIAILWTGKTPTMPGVGPRHQYAERITIYVETADVEDAMERLVELVEDVEEVLKTNEMLKTAAAPAGLLLRPMAVTDEQAMLDLDASAGIGSARLEVDAVYRTTH